MFATLAKNIAYKYSYPSIAPVHVVIAVKGMTGGRVHRLLNILSINHIKAHFPKSKFIFSLCLF